MKNRKRAKRKRKQEAVKPECPALDTLTQHQSIKRTKHVTGEDVQRKVISTGLARRGGNFPDGSSKPLCLNNLQC